MPTSCASGYWQATLRLPAAEMPIASIATAVGFVDQAHFTRHFKRIHGSTPRVYLSEDVAAVPRMRKRRPETSQPCAA